MKKYDYIAGALSILILSVLLLLIQFIILWQFYMQKGPELFALMCAGGVADAWANYCMVPRWVCLFSSAFHCMCVITSLVAYKSMGRRWWYVTLPLVSLCAITITVVLIPLVHVSSVG